MPRVKKITITVDQAEDLERDMGDYVNPSGGRSDVKFELKKLGVPKDIAGIIIGRLDSIGSDLSSLQDGELERMMIDGVSEDLKHLDEYLSKVFVVTGTRSRSKRGYVWEVWG
jgi:hypothetical protein